jgi:hypothetical protein
MTTPFTISFSSRHTGYLCGIFDVSMNVPLSQETFWEMLHLVETRLHFVLTHRRQEGQVGEQTFCDTGFRDVTQCVEEVASLFGEDATVKLDRNMAFYREAGMENMYEWDTELVVGVPRQMEGGIPHGAWGFVALQEDTMHNVWGILREAGILA